MGDARFDKSRKAIKDALLTLLEEKQLAGISMTELAQQAGVSRSTLYAHFSNVQDAYRELTSDFSSSLRPLGIQLHCSAWSEADATGRPFCLAIRDAGAYAPLVRDARFLVTLLDQIEASGFDSEAMESYHAMGLDDAQANAVIRFRMSGCYAVALSQNGTCEWKDIQQTLDTFIRGGINALRVG